MSLDIRLYGQPQETKCVCSKCDNEHTKTEDELYYEGNITHNLGTMADKAGIYYYMWRPEELNIKKAKDLIEPLKEGLNKLKDNPAYYKTFDASNGWGRYVDFVPFVEKYLNACIDYPEAEIYVSR